MKMIVFLFLLTSPFPVQETSHTQNADTEAAYQSITAVLKTFARGESEQSVDILSPALHASFKLTGVVGGRVVSFTREDFLGGIAAKKFGGNSNPLTIDSVEVDGNTAAVEMRLEGPTVRFHHYATLVLSEGTWTLVHSLVEMSSPVPE